MSRGNGRMRIFLDDVDYRMFRYVLSDVVERFDIECLNYCAMPNHYHLALQPKRPNLSEGIQHLNSRYAQWWNQRHSRVGHVFQGRFKDQIVQREGYLRTLCRYIAMNPVRAGLASHPKDWEWSSYGATIGIRPCPPFLSVGIVLEQFGDDDSETLRKRFSEFVVSGQPYDECSDERIRSKERILGNKAFKRSIATRSTDPEAEICELRSLVAESATDLIEKRV
jgi:REP element-mobilizing transposase RayT